ncbi:MULTISPECIES: hypothetical protein [unclassified Bartonella]|uniref:hypothetical protein n=1 Tax=unclassified Bartonella TaxID=2645622 RepID=UPI0035D07D18
MALSFSKILWGLLMALSPVIVGGDSGQLILVWRWWMALGWPLLMVSFFLVR